MTGFLQRLMGFQGGGVVKGRGVDLLVGEVPLVERFSPPRPGEHVIAQTEDVSLGVAEYCDFDMNGRPRGVQIKEKNVDNDDKALKREMTANMITALADEIHKNNVDAGWWMDNDTGEDVRTWPKKFMDLWISAKLMLIVTEVAEAMEGHRKNIPDDKLPQYPMIRVELADAMIRILDMAGGFDNDIFPFGEVVEAKRAYNANRADHKLENRRAAGGKSI